MCGLVFVGGKSSLCLQDVSIFEQFLQCDTYRGEHSTGVASLFKPYGKEATFRLAKAAVDGFDFPKTELWDAVTRMRAPTALGGTSTYATLPKVMFGHNRYATMGAVNAMNAHPFEVGHIILAHNGTLSSGWKTHMEDGYQFEVDSHCVAHNVAKIGITETIKRMRGAFTLIWFNKQDMTLNIIRNDERPFHLWETMIGDWFGCSEEKMGDWLLTRGKVPKTFRRHFECVPGTQYIFDVSDGCVLKQEVVHELPRFRYYQSAYQERTQTYPSSRSYSERQLLEEYDDEEALDLWWNERITQRSSSSSVPGSKGKEKEKARETSPVGTAFEQSLQDDGLYYRMMDIIEFEMFEYKEYPKKKGFGYVKGQIPDCDEFIEVQVHDVREGQFGQEKHMGCRMVSGYEIHGVKTIIGRPQEDCTLYPLGSCVSKDIPLLIEHMEDKGALDDQDFSFLDKLGDDDMPVQTRTMLTGESFTEKEWKTSQHNVCAMCSDPIEFQALECATIENGYCFCGDCIEATNLRKEEIRKKEGPMTVVKVFKTGQAYSREEWNSRAVKFCDRCKFSLLFEDIPDLVMDNQGGVYCEDCANKMAKQIIQKDVYCIACQGYHPTSVMEGNMTHAEWTALGVACTWKIKYKDKFAPKPREVRRPILSLKKAEIRHLCSACGIEYPEHMMSTEQGDLCSSCYMRFHGATTHRKSITEELHEKVIWNGMRITEPLWQKMNKCRFCITRIPFALADKVESMGGAPICPTCQNKVSR